MHSSYLGRLLQVNRIPEDMEYYGKGPLLACKYRDASIMWHRAEQAAQVLEEVINPSLKSGPEEVHGKALLLSCKYRDASVSWQRTE